MLFITFLISGVMVAGLLVLKVIQMKTGRSMFLLSLISKGDHRLREFSHNSVDLYAEWKEEVVFYLTKQLPFRAKNWANKTAIILKDRIEEYTGDIRNSRFLRRNDGISEFLKNVSETEKGGEINDTFEDPETTYSQMSDDDVK